MVLMILVQVIMHSLSEAPSQRCRKGVAIVTKLVDSCYDCARVSPSLSPNQMVMRLRGGWDRPGGDWDQAPGLPPQKQPFTFGQGQGPVVAGGLPPQKQAFSAFRASSGFQQAHSANLAEGYPYGAQVQQFPTRYPPQGPQPQHTVDPGMHPSRFVPSGGYPPPAPPRQEPWGMQERARFPPPGGSRPPLPTPQQYAHKQRFNSVLVRGLKADVEEQEVIDLFDDASAVKSVKILKPNPVYRDRAAYVNFASDEGPAAALKLDGSKPPWNEDMTVSRPSLHRLPMSCFRRGQA